MGLVDWGFRVAGIDLDFGISRGPIRPKNISKGLLHLTVVACISLQKRSELC